jgi:ankyrin repeat protein
MAGKIPPLERKRQEQAEAVQSAAETKRSVEKATQAAAAGLGAGAPVTGGSLGQQALMHVGKAGIQSELEQIKRMSFAEAVRGMQRGPQMAALRTGSKGLQENIPPQSNQYVRACEERALELLPEAIQAGGLNLPMDNPTGATAIQALAALERPVDLMDGNGPLNALHRAVLQGDLKRTRTLISLGVDLNVLGAPGSPEMSQEPAAVIAIYRSPDEQRSELLGLLLKAGADVAWANRDGLTLLHYALVDRSGNACRQLIEAGADIEARDARGHTALMRAAWLPAMGGDATTDVVKMLLAHGASTAAADPEGMTALHYAAAQQDPEVIQLLLAAKADPHAQHATGETPLDIAKRVGSPVVAELLEKAG